MRWSMPRSVSEAQVWHFQLLAALDWIRTLLTQYQLNSYPIKSKKSRQTDRQMLLEINIFKLFLFTQGHASQPLDYFKYFLGW